MLLTIIFSVISLCVGLGVGFFVLWMKSRRDQQALDQRSRSVIDRAKKDASDIKYNAKREAKQIIREERDILEKSMKSQRSELKEQERDLAKKELDIDRKIDEAKREAERFRTKQKEVEKEKEHLSQEIGLYKERQSEVVEKLSEVAHMTKEEAKELFVESVAEEAKVDAAKAVRRIEQEAKEEAEKKAKRVIGISIQRFAGEYVADSTISTVELPSDDVKGRLIGREGRNIRAFEQICGVDLLIDDTPELVVISSFNVVRREVARMTILKLIADGRIHPAKIEEFHEKSRSEFEAKLKDLGEKAQMEIGVHGIHPEILKLVGALNWRTSYTQNQYQHALEAAFICGAMAAELGLNVKQARRAGLLHDIGKVLDASAEGSHAVTGADFAKKYGESPDIVHAIRAHHDDEKPESVLAHLVAASDAISGARPGARKALMESYVSRLTDIERIVNDFPGVSKSYAISAGREIRVLVENSSVNDTETVMLSRNIAKKIESEMTYPGSIKVTVIRETRSVGIAR